MTNNLSVDIHFTKELGIFRSKLSDLKDGKGAVISISGESGFGKSYLLEAIESLSAQKNSNVTCVSVRNQGPIGKFNVGNIQPLFPFTKAMENILSDTSKARKKFALRAGLTVLTGIPIAGDFIYMVKELGKDWRQFKNDKSSTGAKKVSTGAADFFDSFSSLADKSPIVLLFDDMHWSDAQSIELLGLFTDNIHKIPLMIVFAYKKTQIQRKGVPLLSYLNNYLNKHDNITSIELQPFNKIQLSEFCRFMLPNYQPNEKFETWLYDRSYGVPGVISEYLNYFQQKSPFNADGSLNENFANSDYLPASVQSAFSKILDKISDEERNTLAICSAEGRKFTAMIVSELLNTDVLSTIKALRALQMKTGVIKSVGAQMRYGVKTTVYEFTQAFYHNFFENSLEYEEHIALHGQIAALLKQKFEDAENESIKQEIAPYLAAHSAESGDEETTKSMLLIAAKTAKDFGSQEIIQSAYDNFREIEEYGYRRFDEEDSDIEPSPENVVFQSMLQPGAPGAEDERPQDIDGKHADSGEYKESSIAQADTQDFKTFRKALATAFHDGKYSFVAVESTAYLNDNESDLTIAEQAQLMGIAIRAYSENNETGSAEKIAERALDLTEGTTDLIANCFVMNSCAVFYSSSGKIEKATELMLELAKKANILPPELKLLTLSNIAMLTNTSSPGQSGQYYNTIRQLASQLKFDEFANDIFGMT